MTVATTRPETMLGELRLPSIRATSATGDLHGRTVRPRSWTATFPSSWMRSPTLSSATGVVKGSRPPTTRTIFEAGRRQTCRFIQVSRTAHMTAAAGPYAGLDGFEARQRVVADLDRLGLLGAHRGVRGSPGRCQRCKNAVGAARFHAWVRATKPLPEPAIRAVETESSGSHRELDPDLLRVDVTTSGLVLSRSLGGQRIPAWHCRLPGGHVPGRIHALRALRLRPHRADPRSSIHVSARASWPFSTPAGPKTTDLRTLLPNSLLHHGFDILFFWVARMIMMGIELPDRSRSARSTSTASCATRAAEDVQDQGQRVDPFELTEKYGTDAVRMGCFRRRSRHRHRPHGERRKRSHFPQALERGAFRFMNWSGPAWNRGFPMPDGPASPSPGNRAKPRSRTAGYSAPERRPNSERAMSANGYHEPRRSCGSSSARVLRLVSRDKKAALQGRLGLDSGWATSLPSLKPTAPAPSSDAFITEELWQPWP